MPRGRGVSEKDGKEDLLLGRGCQGEKEIMEWVIDC